MRTSDVNNSGTVRKQAKYKFHAKYKFKFTKYDSVGSDKN